MKPGRQWIVVDADFYDNNFTHALIERFGWAGVGLFLAFLCACKRNHIPGRINYRGELDGLEKLGVDSLRLVDTEGLPFTLDEYWEFTGRYKQTRRTRQGHSWHVFCTGWEDWQHDRKTVSARDRKRRSRANSVTPMSRTDTDTDNDIYKTGVTRHKNQPPKPLEPPAYPDWEGDPQPTEPVVDLKVALAQLMRYKDVDG